MKNDNDYHPFAGPFVNVSKQPPAENNIAYVFNTAVGMLYGRMVIDHEKDAGYRGNDKQIKGDKS